MDNKIEEDPIIPKSLNTLEIDVKSGNYINVRHNDNFLLNGFELNKEIILQLLQYDNKYKTKLFKFLKSVIIKQYLNSYEINEKNMIINNIHYQIYQILQNNQENTLKYFNNYGIFTNLIYINKIIIPFYDIYKENIIYYNNIKNILDNLITNFSFQSITLDDPPKSNSNSISSIDISSVDETNKKVLKNINKLLFNLNKFKFIKKNSDGPIISLLGLSILLPNDKNGNKDPDRIPKILIDYIYYNIYLIINNILNMKGLYTDINLSYINYIKKNLNAEKISTILKNIESINKKFYNIQMFDITTLCKSFFFKYLENLINYNLYIYFVKKIDK